MNHTIDPPQDLDWDTISDEVDDMTDDKVIDILRHMSSNTFEVIYLTPMRRTLKQVLYDERKYGDE